MPLLAAWIGSLITSLASFFGLVVAKRVALVLAAVAAFAALAGTFYVAVGAAVGALGFVMPAGVVQGIGWMVPTQLDDCVVAYATVRVARFAFDSGTWVIGIQSR